MDIVNTNRLRVSVRPYRREYAERFTDVRFGAYNTADHGMPRRERNWYATLLGIVAHVKWRPDGKRAADSRSELHS